MFQVRHIVSSDSGILLSILQNKKKPNVVFYIKATLTDYNCHILKCQCNCLEYKN